MLVIDPIFWLGLSILLVAVSLTAVLIVAVPAFQELGRAARSAEKLFDTLNRELPPTLEAMRLTGLEVSELTEDVSQGVQSAGQVVKQVDQSIAGVRQQVQKAQGTSRSVLTGIKTAWNTLTQAPTKSSKLRRADDDPLDFAERTPSEFGRANRASPNRFTPDRTSEAMRGRQLERYRDEPDFEPPYLEVEDYDDDLLNEPPDEELLQVEQNSNNGNGSEHRDPIHSRDRHPAQRDREY